MVSLNPNPPNPNFFFDPMNMALPGLGSLPPATTPPASSATAAATTANTAATLGSDDPSKKIRKPYTITKSRESWTDQEHEKFLEALQLFDRDWKKIEAFVGSKTVIQIRSHAQKYFLKVQKNGTSEHVPPPRPKRKAAHPYPHKASKTAPVVSQAMELLQSSSSLHDPGYVLRPDSSSILRNPSTSASLSSWTCNNVPPVGMKHVAKDDKGLVQSVMAHNYGCSSSHENPQRTWPASEINDQGIHIMPDFAQVYSFIGSVFDPDASDHLQRLKEMDPINVETVLLLMKNLSINLTSPEFEDQRRLLSSYDPDSQMAKSGGLHNTICADKLDNAIPSALKAGRV
ncbi:protein REVEILLE 6-like isoform X2 [Malania oleifera]|uniref:protein REVEILLE 6-like isoform X2 n=1 Tax=Malania oleifera TaxID=397392 RepID=UPI0025AE7853|nr:protein REVEILLE 6-like isoform X2 [Malania oleifera]